MFALKRFTIALSLAVFSFTFAMSDAEAQRYGNNNQKPAGKQIKDMKDHTLEGPFMGIQRGGVIVQITDNNAMMKNVFAQLLSRPINDGTGILNPTAVYVEGTALPDGLKNASKRGWYARFTATVDEEGKVKDKVTALQVFTPTSEEELAVEVTPGAEGEVVGKIVTCIRGKLIVLAKKGKIRKIQATYDESDFAINLGVADLSVLSPGDTIKVSAKDVDAGKGYYIAARIDAKLAQPYTTGKRKPAAPAAGNAANPFGVSQGEPEKAN